MAQDCNAPLQAGGLDSRSRRRRGGLGGRIACSLGFVAGRQPLIAHPPHLPITQSSRLCKRLGRLRQVAGRLYVSKAARRSLVCCLRAEAGQRSATRLPDGFAGPASVGPLRDNSRTLQLGGLAIRRRCTISAPAGAQDGGPGTRGLGSSGWPMPRLLATDWTLATTERWSRPSRRWEGGSRPQALRNAQGHEAKRATAALVSWLRPDELRWSIEGAHTVPGLCA